MSKSKEVNNPKDNPCEGERYRDGCTGIGVPKHTCPYAEDVNDDKTTLCNCCDICTHECCQDI